MEEVKANPIERTLGNHGSFPERISRTEACFSSYASTNYYYRISGWLAGNPLRKNTRHLVDEYVLKNGFQLKEVSLCFFVWGFKHICIDAFSEDRFFFRRKFHLCINGRQEHEESTRGWGRECRHIPKRNCRESTWLSMCRKATWAANGLTLLLRSIFLPNWVV